MRDFSPSGEAPLAEIMPGFARFSL